MTAKQKITSIVRNMMRMAYHSNVADKFYLDTFSPKCTKTKMVIKNKSEASKERLDNLYELGENIKSAIEIVCPHVFIIYFTDEPGDEDAFVRCDFITLSDCDKPTKRNK